MSDPVRDLRRELLAAAERQQRHAVAVRTSRRWLARPGLRGRRLRLALVAAAVLVVAVGTASAFGGVRDFFLDRGFSGLPPKGAAPSAPQRGELVARWFGFSATVTPGRPGPLVRAWLYADGRLIWDRPSHAKRSQLTSGLLEQRLSPEGVELVRSAIAELFRRSGTLLETVPSGDFGPTGRSALLVPPNYGSGWGLVDVHDGDRIVRLPWRPRSENDYYYEGTLATPEQLAELRRVDALFTDPTSVLPASAWADRDVKGYVASHYAACIHRWRPKKVPQPLSLLPPRAAELLRGKTRAEGDWMEGGLPGLQCFKLTTEEAREVNKALSGLEPPSELERFTAQGNGPVYRVAKIGHPARTDIWLTPYFPDGRFTYPIGPG
jgi:hypothetical protein